jgi:hypothetical protein
MTSTAGPQPSGASTGNDSHGSRISQDRATGILLGGPPLAWTLTRVTRGRSWTSKIAGRSVRAVTHAQTTNHLTLLLLEACIACRHTVSCDRCSQKKKKKCQILLQGRSFFGAIDRQNISGGHPD